MLDWIKILFRRKLVQYVSETFTWALEIMKKIISKISEFTRGYQTKKGETRR
jgi:hypothetical protein